jgi:hypothetical protein
MSKIPVLKDILSDSTSKKEELAGESKKLSVDAQGELIRLMADVGTGIWRIHQGHTGAKAEPQKELNSILRTVESIWSIMAGKGVEIKDHTGDMITGGEALRIIAFQPSSGITRDTVVETLKPTVYYKDKMVQMGEVIVGIPIKK